MPGPAPDHPVILESWRGSHPEAFHRGAVCVAKDGELIFSVGDPDALACLRSAAKPFQALAVLETGAAERFALEDRHLALMIASHGGEPRHVRVAAEILARGGLGVEHLACGAHPPLHAPSASLLAARGEAPGVLHNNCSGKHGGMLLAALASGDPIEGYLDPSHPHQRRVRRVLAEAAGLAATELPTAVDGCSAPTFHLPLGGSAVAWSRFAQRAARGGTSEQRLTAALRAEPFCIGGTGRLDSALLALTDGAVLAKIGAEGYYGAAWPARGIGVALHIDDGQWNASERVLLEVLGRLGALEGIGAPSLAAWADPVRRNHRGLEVGRARFTDALAELRPA